MLELFTFTNILAFFVGACISAIINVTGVGGGVLYVPAIVLFFGTSPIMAVGTASVIASLTKALSTINHILNKQVNWQIVLYFLIGAIPSVVICGIFLLEAIKSDPAKNDAIQQFVRYFIIVIMLVSAYLIISPPKTAKPDQLRKFALFISGIVIGAVIAITGVGGGVLIIPVLALLTNASMKSIVSSSIIIGLLISFLIGFLYASDGQVDVALIVSMTAGSFLGVFVSNKIFLRMNDAFLQKVIAIIIGLSAISMIDWQAILAT